jgi:hypothetical protein
MSETATDYHPENLDRFERFTEVAGLQIADPEARIGAIQSMDADKFLDVLAVSNGLLRGEEKFQRWSGETAKVNISGAVLGVDLEPPEHSHEMFKGFYDKFSSELGASEHDLQKSAVEMYFAIIGTHMFADGNGRLARAAYHLVKNGELPEESVILERSKGIAQATQAVNQGAVRVLYDRNGIVTEYLNDVAADDTQEEASPIFVSGGMTQQTKYVAARRVMMRNGEWPEDAPEILKIKNWPEDKRQQFNSEYELVREEWLAAYINTAGAYAPGLAKLIESSD